MRLPPLRPTSLTLSPPPRRRPNPPRVQAQSGGKLLSAIAAGVLGNNKGAAPTPLVVVPPVAALPAPQTAPQIAGPVAVRTSTPVTVSGPVNVRAAAGRSAPHAAAAAPLSHFGFSHWRAHLRHFTGHHRYPHWTSAGASPAQLPPGTDYPLPPPHTHTLYWPPLARLRPLCSS